MTNDDLNSGSNGWSQWAKHVLRELKRLSESQEKMSERFSKDIMKLRDDVNEDVLDIKTDIARLQVKAGIWGLIGASIPVAVGLGIWVLKAVV